MIMFRVLLCLPFILLPSSAFCFQSAKPLASTDDRTPEGAVAGLDVADGVELKLFAAEPLLLSPSNIDIDHLETSFHPVHFRTALHSFFY